MKRRNRIPRSFYDKRDLPTPRAEWWPEDSGDLRRALTDDDVPRVLIGDGQHVRPPSIGERTFDVVRTEKCRRVLTVDRESKIVRVEAGIRWGELQEELAERGLTLERYRLSPATATVGGLLARYQPIHRELWDGNLRTGLVALSAVTGERDYRYIPAPRKASGPDLRWLFVGSEGAFGAILDASIVAWAPSPARLFRFDVEDFAVAARFVASLWDAGVHPSWTHYTTYRASPDELLVALHAPRPILDATSRLVAERCPMTFEESEGDDVATTRRRLEAAHPDRRSPGSSSRTFMGVFSTRDVTDVMTALTELVENVTITSWSRHHAQMFVRYANGKTLSELPANIAARALDVRPVIDDEAIRWSHAAQTLKRTLDPRRTLAVGP